MNKTNLKPLMLIVAAVFILWGFGYQTAWKFYSTDVDGVITESRDVPSTGAPRYATEYTIQKADDSQQTYTAGATDASLPRSLAVGTIIRKPVNSFEYTINNEPKSFPLIFYAVASGIALCLLGWAFVLLGRAKKAQ